jgi:hypothetical protein
MSGVASALSQSIGVAASRSASVTCSAVQNGVAAGLKSCLVAVRWGDYGVFAFVDPNVVRHSNGPVVAGTLVSISTD